jgi:hypothetical protein
MRFRVFAFRAFRFVISASRFRALAGQFQSTRSFPDVPQPPIALLFFFLNRPIR